MVNVHESDYEQYNEYSFHFGLLFFRFLRIEQTDLDLVLVRMPFVQDLRQCGCRVIKAAIAILQKTNIPVDVVLSVPMCPDQ